MTTINLTQSAHAQLMDMRSVSNGHGTASKTVEYLIDIELGVAERSCPDCAGYKSTIEALKKQSESDSEPIDCPDCGGYQAAIDTLQYKLDNTSPTVDKDSLTNLTSEVERLLAENETLRTSKDGAFVLLLEDENARYKKEIAKMQIELEAWNVQE